MARFFRLRAIIIGVAFALTIGVADNSLKAGPPAKNYALAGQLLVAKPGLGDPRFRQTVIFMVKHDDSGAFGLIVNRKLGPLPFAQLLTTLRTAPDGIKGSIIAHFGGPLEPRRGFILHSADYTKSPLYSVNKRYSITFDAAIVRAIAAGRGPARAILAIGYAGWRAGQLERELKNKDWVVAPASDALLFDSDYSTKWARAYAARYLNI
jgi:putative transcriptional regulator